MNLKKLYKPNKDFKERSKVLFLSAYKTKFPIEAQKAPAFRYFLRGAAFGAAMVVVLTAGATYADQKNVGVSSVLYPLKRTSESVKVAFTNQSEKTEIHLELAERRLEEIKEVREKNPGNPKLESLSKDFENEIHNSLLKVEFPKSLQQAKTSAKLNLEVEKENEDSKTPPVAGAPMMAATEIATEDSKLAGDEKSENEDSRGIERALEEKDSRTSPSNKFLNFSEQQQRACKFWKKIIEEKDFAATDLVNKTPEILEKYNENCESFFGSVIIKTEGSEVEVEIED